VSILPHEAKAGLWLFCRWSNTILFEVIMWQGRYIKRQLLGFRI